MGSLRVLGKRMLGMKSVLTVRIAGIGVVSRDKSKGCLIALHTLELSRVVRVERSVLWFYVGTLNSPGKATGVSYWPENHTHRFRFANRCFKPPQIGSSNTSKTIGVLKV